MVVDQMDALAMQNWEHVQVRINSLIILQVIDEGICGCVVRVLAP